MVSLWVFIFVLRFFILWLHWGLVAASGLLIAAHGLLLVVSHRLSCSTARGIFPDQGSNPCLLHWQADSLPLSHQGSPAIGLLSLFR